MTATDRTADAATHREVPVIGRSPTPSLGPSASNTPYEQVEAVVAVGEGLCEGPNRGKVGEIVHHRGQVHARLPV